MSAEVVRAAEWCISFRTGPPAATATIVDAHFADGMWTVNVKGLWPFAMPPRGVPAPSPTREPWQETWFVTDCTVHIDPESPYELQESSTGGGITATPPGRLRQHRRFATD
jgi:hypothetical protein